MLGKPHCNISEEKSYIPLHTGKYLNDDGNLIIEKIQALPEYIKVRALIKVSK